ncbi:MAG: hypothetical protein ACRDTX_23515 [Pseudonocardiaceae bacterium]
MISPPGRRCSSCEAAVLRSEREPAPRDIPFPTQTGGRGRHRDDAVNSQTGAGSRLFGWLR